MSRDEIYAPQQRGGAYYMYCVNDGQVLKFYSGRVSTSIVVTEWLINRSIENVLASKPVRVALKKHWQRRRRRRSIWYIKGIYERKKNRLSQCVVKRNRLTAESFLAKNSSLFFGPPIFGILLSALFDGDFRASPVMWRSTLLFGTLESWQSRWIITNEEKLQNSFFYWIFWY